MIPCIYYKKIIVCGSISLVIALWAHIFPHILHWSASISIFLRQFYPGCLVKFADSTITFFFIAALSIRWFGQIVALPWWTWLLFLLRYYFIDKRTWWYLFSSSSPPTFSALFCCSRLMSVLITEILKISWGIVLGSFLEISSLCNGW